MIEIKIDPPVVNGFHHNAVTKHQDLDPKLLLTAQLFVQDLIQRAKIEVQKKLVASETQVNFF